MKTLRKSTLAILCAVVVLQSGCGKPNPATGVPEPPLVTAARVSDEEAHTLHQLSSLVGDLNRQGLLSKEKTYKADLLLLKAARDTKTFNTNARLFTNFDATNKRVLFDL